MSRYQPPKETDLNQRLEVCEDEPIRVPGSVQRHGFYWVWMLRRNMLQSLVKTLKSF